MRLSPDALRLAVPVMALAALLAGVFWLRPNAAGYAGLNLLFNYAVPIALATLAQMIIMSVNDLDLSMGAFVSFVACVTATYLNDTPLTGVLILMASVAAYAVIGVVTPLHTGHVRVGEHSVRDGHGAARAHRLVRGQREQCVWQHALTALKPAMPSQECSSRAPILAARRLPADHAVDLEVDGLEFLRIEIHRRRSHPSPAPARTPNRGPREP